MDLKGLKDNQFLQAVAVVALFWLAIKLKYVLIIIFAAFVLSTSLYPLVLYLKKKGLPIYLAISLPIVILVFGFGLLTYLLVPPFAHRFVELTDHLSDYINSANAQLGVNINTKGVTNVINDRFGSISSAAFKLSTKAFAVMISVIAVIVLTIYWLGSYNSVRKNIIVLFRGTTRKKIDDIWSRIEIKMRDWVRAHLMLNSAVAAMVWLALTILGIPFAELMAFIAFLIEIIPTLGPILAAAPAILLGFSISGVKGVLVFFAYLAIQQIENHILSPLLLGKTVRLHPIVIIISLLVGARLMGILGALIAVPLTLCFSAVVDSYQADLEKTRKKRSKKLTRAG
jgi:predicted PurR-regulated permease PerM